MFHLLELKPCLDHLYLFKILFIINNLCIFHPLLINFDIIRIGIEIVLTLNHFSLLDLYFMNSFLFLWRYSIKHKALIHLYWLYMSNCRLNLQMAHLIEYFLIASDSHCQLLINSVFVLNYSIGVIQEVLTLGYLQLSLVVLVLEFFGPLLLFFKTKLMLFDVRSQVVNLFLRVFELYLFFVELFNNLLQLCLVDS